MEVTREQELPAAIAAAGLELDDVSEVVLTHAHGDHIDGLVHVHARVLIHETKLEFLASTMARVMRRVLRQPLPAGFAPEPFTLDGGPFGAFARSRSLSDDGRIVAVDTPGHTPGHISVICVDDSGRHVMLAGDTTDSLEQLYALRADAVAPDPKVHIATMRTILAHCAAHPTIYLPSHDPDRRCDARQRRGARGRGARLTPFGEGACLSASPHASPPVRDEKGGRLLTAPTSNCGWRGLGATDVKAGSRSSRRRGCARRTARRRRA